MSAAALFSNYSCELGEGPAYDPYSDSLFWFDIVNGLMLEQAEAGQTPRQHKIGQMASAAAAIDADRHLIFTETGFFVRDRRTGALTLHTALEADKPGTRSNDARVHPCGALWAGTMGKNAETGAGAIYWFFRGEVRLLYPGISISNSIAFSPDGTVAYFVDTAVDTVMRVACDPHTGLPTGEPVVFATGAKTGGHDGSVVDRDGALWNARWGEGRLVVYNPDGREIRSVTLPANQVSCPAFLGRNADRMVVTSARFSLDAGQLAADPQAGKTFLLDLPVIGQVEPAVRID